MEMEKTADATMVSLLLIGGSFPRLGRGIDYMACPFLLSLSRGEARGAIAPAVSVPAVGQAKAIENGG
eukprot:scaffold4400_cov124-Isochrysis_galbana.AAC.5